MKLTPATSLAALTLIAAGGFMAGRISSPGTSQGGLQDAPADRKSSRTTSRDSMSGGLGTRQSARTTKTQHAEKGDAKDRLVRLESIIRNENALDRNRALLAFIDQLAPQDFEAAISRFKELGLEDSRNGEMSLLLTAWAQADPQMAMAYANKNPDDDFTRDTILTSWASTDAESAIRWAKANYTGDGANPYMSGIIRGIAGTDMARATELLTSMPRSVERGKGLDSILPHLLELGADATRSWIGAIKDDALRSGAMMRSAEQLAKTDPAGTAAWLLANPGEAKQRMLDNVYGAWASDDKNAAMTSFSALPAGEDRSNALRGLVSNFATENPKEAISLMDRYPNDVTDRVIQNFVWHSFGTDPTLAATEIGRMADQEQRDRTYRRTLEIWMDRDPAAAQAWIKTNPLSESVLKHLNCQTGQN